MPALDPDGSTYSLRMPAALKRLASERAKLEDRTLGQLIRRALKLYLRKVRVKEELNATFGKLGTPPIPPAVPKKDRNIEPHPLKLTPGEKAATQREKRRLEAAAKAERLKRGRKR